MVYKHTKPRWSVLLVSLLVMTLGATGCGSADDAQAWQPDIACEDGVTPGDAVQPLEPFMGLPFAEEDIAKLTISSGWVTAQDEVDIVKDCDHHALDIELAPNNSATCDEIEVLAPADGWAVATYQADVEIGAADADPPKNQLHTDPVTGKTGYTGIAGSVVQIILDVPEFNTPGAVGGSRPTVQLMHLEDVASHLAWINPLAKPPVEITGGGTAARWYPQGMARSQTSVIAGDENNPPATYVHRGDRIATLGRTGINFGQDDLYNPVNHTVTPQGIPWDPQGVGVNVPLERACQLHMFMYTGRDATGTKLGAFDPTDMYLQIRGRPGTDSYENPYNPALNAWVMGLDAAIQQHPDGRPVGAR